MSLSFTSVSLMAYLRISDEMFDRSFLTSAFIRLMSRVVSSPT